MYTNWPTFANGMDYTAFFFEELMPLIYGWFPTSDKKEDNYIAGLSMGAAGALKFAVANPERFAGCICLSSCGKEYSLDYVDDGDRTSPPKTQQHNGIVNAGEIEKFYYSTDPKAKKPVMFWISFTISTRSDIGKGFRYFSIFSR